MMQHPTSKTPVQALDLDFGKNDLHTPYFGHFLTLPHLYHGLRQVELPIIIFLQLNSSDTLDGVE